MQQNFSIPETGFLRLPQVLSALPISKSLFYAGIASGKYPRGHKLGARATGWRCEDIRALIEKLSAGDEAQK